MRKILRLLVCLSAVNIVTAQATDMVRPVDIPKPADITGAIAAFNEERIEVAKPLLETASHETSTKNEALLYLGRIAFEEGDAEKARDLLSAAVDIEPNSSAEYYWLGRAYGELALKANLLKQASYASSVHKYFQLAADADPKNVLAQRGLFEFYIVAPSIMGGSLEKAEQTLSVIRQLSPVDADIKLLSLYARKEQHEQALAQAKLLIAKYPDSAEALFVAGHTLREQKQLPEAIKAFEAAAKIPATRTNKMFVESASYSFSETCHWANTRLDEAIPNLEKFIAVHGSDKRFNRNWPLWTLAKMYKQQGNLDKYKSLRAQLDPGYLKQDKQIKAEVETADKEKG